MPVRHAVQTLRARLQSLRRAGFVRSVGVLVGGTAFAQAITVLVLPLVTRLYTPDDFSVLAVFVSILSIISVAACLRLEIAIPMPESDEDAANLLALALCACTVVAALTGLIVWWFPTQIVSLVEQPALHPYLWLLPLGIWLAGAYAAVQFWSTRKKKFGTIAKTRIAQAIGGTGTQLGLGWAGIAPFGLLLGQVVNNGAGLVGLGREVFHEDRIAFRRISWDGMCRTLQQYDRFPKYSTLEALTNTAGIQLPIIIIAALAAGPEAGYLMLATRVMAAPMGLIGGAVSQVYLSRAPDELRTGCLARFTSKIISGLTKSGVGPLIFAGIISPTVFPLIFGEKWQRAGELVAWMTPWFVMQFIASPISMALHITQNQKSALYLQASGAVLRIGSIFLAYQFSRTQIIEWYAISGFLFYTAYIYTIFVKIKIKPIEMLNLVRFNFLIILGWIILAIAICMAL